MNSKEIDKEIQARKDRVMRNKLYGKTVNVSAWKSHKESWKENLKRYRKEMRDIDNPYEVNKMKLISNNIDICLLNLDICTMQIKIAELREHNTKIKTNCK